MISLGTWYNSRYSDYQALIKKRPVYSDSKSELAAGAITIEGGCLLISLGTVAGVVYTTLILGCQPLLSLIFESVLSVGEYEKVIFELPSASNKILNV